MEHNKKGVDKINHLRRYHTYVTRCEREQCLHRVSGSSAPHRQRLLADGGGVRGPGHRYGLQRTGRRSSKLKCLTISPLNYMSTRPYIQK